MDLNILIVFLLRLGFMFFFFELGGVCDCLIDRFGRDNVT